MSKHTSAPWIWERVEEPGCIPVTTLRGPDVLCRFWDIGVDGSRDANLIAAAPDMLEALRNILKFPNDYQAWNAVSAAIDKAEGRSEAEA